MELLVSPSSVEEARNALAADIIDVKKPSEGSLGANYPWVIREIKSITHKPVSAAIGDFSYLPGGAALAALGAATAGADYIKIGLKFSGAAEAHDLINGVVRAVKEDFPEKYVVIAAYADYARLNTISPEEMAPLAAQAGADIAMIDTGIKDGKSLFDYYSEEDLQAFTDANRALGLKTALAGSLRFEDLEALKRIDPDIIGVRGMVCGGDRSAVVVKELVEEAMQLIR
ncbi:MAG: (5-formylfuran-3-yl)methyl phosphate synthase [Methanomicrobiales archaeon]|nr:(5-formylfuran-3-yl)methyl phosphate synthase [Methanomicrobiales archaeon]